MSTATWAGELLVATATTDAWGLASEGFSRLLGRGDPDRTRAVERRLEETHRRLTEATGTDREWRQAALEEEQWETALEDLLREDPDLEADLNALVQQIQTRLLRELLRRKRPAARQTLRERPLRAPDRPRLYEQGPGLYEQGPAAPSPAPLRGLGGDQPGD